MYKESIPWIEGTPLGLSIREIEFVPPHMHDDLIEIIFCLKGSVVFNYEYEQFTLTEGEFISVDKDAHYLYSGKDDICVSFYIDLNWFKEKYPYVTDALFVCEATEDSLTPRRLCHNQLKGMLIALLFYLGNHETYEHDYRSTITNSIEKILLLFIREFDIIFFYNPYLEYKEELMETNHDIMRYMQEHSSGKITLDSMSADLGITKKAVAEAIGVNLGFRRCLRYLRAYKSQKMLLSTGRNITEISALCGFSDPKYYYKAFREWYKCTPREFRKSYTKKMNKPCLEKSLGISDTYDCMSEVMLEHYLDFFLI